MKDTLKTKTVVEGIAVALTLCTFFFDIVGVFGLLFAVVGTVAAIGLAIVVCWRRPLEDQAR